jgi:hypothetical protein
MFMQDIREDPILLNPWRDIPRDMISLVHHIIKATRILLARRVFDDTHSSSSTYSSNTPSSNTP